MKKIKKISIVAVILVLACMFFVSCGEEDPLAPTVGTWTMTEVEYAGQTLTTEDLKATGEFDQMPTFEIREDGTCTFEFMGTGGEGTIVANEDGTFKLTDDTKAELPFEIDDSGKLRLDYSAMGMIMIFEK